MGKRKFILIHQSLSAEKARRRWINAKWLFFGSSYVDRMRWESALGKVSKINYKDELSRVSYALRNEFIGWSADLGKPHWDKWYWWLTRLATRNNLTSKLYCRICYIEALKSVLDKYNEDLIIISDSWALLDVIRMNWKKEMKIVEPFSLEHGSLRTKDYLLEKTHFTLSWINFLKRSFIEWFASRISALSTPMAKGRLYKDNHTVIHTCVDDACLGADGRFKDRYFPGLSDYLTRRDEQVSTLVWICNLKKMSLIKAFRWFKRNIDSFLIPQDYYGLHDCIYSVFTVIKSSLLRFSQKSSIFRGVDVSALLEHEQTLQARETGAAYFTNRIAMLRTWKKLGYRLDFYIDFWELKNCEVEVIIGIRKYYPQCKIVSYQHGALIPKMMFFNYKTTEDEFNASVHADIGIVNSRVNKDFLLMEGFPDSFIKIGPALRYMWLKNYSSHKTADQKREGLLVCLSLSESISLEMLENVYQAFLNIRGIQIYIKFHPMANPDILKRKLSFKWPDTFKIAEGNMESCLERVRVAVISQSSAMVDAVCMGVPTAIIGLETDIDIIPFDMLSVANREPGEWLWDIAYDPEQLRKSVMKFYNDTEIKAYDIAEDLFEFSWKGLDEVLTKK